MPGGVLHVGSRLADSIRHAIDGPVLRYQHLIWSRYVVTGSFPQGKYPQAARKPTRSRYASSAQRLLATMAVRFAAP